MIANPLPSFFRRAACAFAFCTLGGMLSGAVWAGPAAPDDHYERFGAAYQRVIDQAHELADAVMADRAGQEGLAALADIAQALAQRLDREDGPHDLACIYRGIAKDIAKKGAAYAAATDDAGRRQARDALIRLLNDAALVTPTQPAPTAP